MYTVLGDRWLLGVELAAMAYAVGEQVEAEKTPFAWYRGTIEQSLGDSYAIRFGVSDVQVVDGGKVRTVGARLSDAPPRLSLRPMSSASAVSASPRVVETRSTDPQRRVDALSEQLIREQTERRKLEERLLACEHLIGDTGPLKQRRQDDSVARIEQRLEQLERSTRADLAINQQRTTEGLRTERELERRVSAVETGVKTVREELDNQLAALTARVASQSLSTSLASIPAPMRTLHSSSSSNSTRGSTSGSLESPVPLDTTGIMQQVEAALAEAKTVSSAEIQAAEERILAALDTVEARVAQACAADMEALEGQIQATVDELAVRRPDQTPTSGANSDNTSILSSSVPEDMKRFDSIAGPDQFAELQSAVELHSEVLDRLHMEKAEDIAATMEKLQHLLEAHSTISAAVAEVAARQAQLEEAVEKLQPPRASATDHTLAASQQLARSDQADGAPMDSNLASAASSAAAISCSPEELDKLETRILATLTTVGGELSERVTMLEGAVAADDLEEDGGPLSQ
eukprot:COSAG02_NODE_483_length_21396_cov_20.544801_1_plen_519_part_00